MSLSSQGVSDAEQLRGTFDDAVAAGSEELLDEAIATLTDDEFVSTEEYADAVLGPLPTALLPATLTRMLDERLTKPHHGSFIRKSWEALPAPSKAQVASSLDKHLREDVPGHQWESALAFLEALKSDVWDRLRAQTRLRLREVVLRDFQTGLYDRYLQRSTSGHLGEQLSWLWKNFQRNDLSFEAFCKMVKVDQWETQNYAGSVLLDQFPKMELNEADVTRIAEHVAACIRRDSTAVKNLVKQLPEDWKAHIEAAQTRFKEARTRYLNSDDDMPF